ncbi:MAG: hypothetical protein JNL61_06445, partial [Rhizobiaceae bacterium]|nr:hypothetical protein [Rhizobiaceae bacterium]
MDLILDHLDDWHTGWSMGTFGAVAEFHRDACEPLISERRERSTRATDRGAIRFDRLAVSRLRPVAYEMLSPKAGRWNQGVTLCMAAGDAARSCRSVLTELGAAILFDMGLSPPQCDFCIRIGDAALLSLLRANLGRSLFEAENPAMPAILAAHPHRVALTAAGRVEVFQKIGGPDTGGVSPAGPHTHVLPKLLRTGRTHSANMPVPSNLVPVAFMHLPGGLVDTAFDLDRHERFQTLLRRWGNQDLHSF